MIKSTSMDLNIYKINPLSLGSQHCPYDYIRIYDGINELSPVIGTFCGMGKFPYSIIGTGRDLYVEFVSSPAGPLLNTGFHFNVGNWPGHVETSGIICFLAPFLFFFPNCCSHRLKKKKKYHF